MAEAGCQRVSLTLKGKMRVRAYENEADRYIQGLLDSGVQVSFHHKGKQCEIEYLRHPRG